MNEIIFNLVHEKSSFQLLNGTMKASLLASGLSTDLVIPRSGRFD